MVPVVMTACVKIFKKAREHLSEWMSKHVSPRSQTHQLDISVESLINFTVADVDLTEPSDDDENFDFNVKDHHEMKEI